MGLEFNIASDSARSQLRSLILTQAEEGRQCNSGTRRPLGEGLKRVEIKKERPVEDSEVNDDGVGERL